MKIIDIHQHFSIPEYFDYLEKNNALMEDSILLPRKSVSEMIAMMDDAGTDLAVLTISSPHPYFKETADEGIALCRKINEAAADLRRRYPDRFRFHAVVPLPDIDAAIDEAIYALDNLGASGIKLASNSRGLYLGDPAMDPLFEELNKRGAIINIHPHRPEPLNDALYSARIIPVFEFFADTTRAVLNMLGHKIPDRFPNVKIIVPHCGAFLPNIADRGQQFMPLLMNIGVLKENIKIKENLYKFYYDMAGNPTPDLLPLLTRFVPASHIMYGSDYPFTPVHKCFERIHQISTFIDGHDELSRHKEKFFHANAEHLYGL